MGERGAAPLVISPADLHALNERRQQHERTRLCHMPERGLYFGLRGFVYTCCFNKTHPAGRYPERSIREIWEGAEVREQRAALARRDLSYGCGGCYSLIKSGNFNSLPLRTYDHYAADNRGMPAKMDFELFNTCNLECIMCRGEFSSAIRANRERLPPIPSPYDDTFFEQVDEFIPSLRSSHFLGGEPFLIPQYVALWERMSDLNPQVALSVQTNGTVLTPRIKEVLGRMHFDINVSLDAATKSTYESIRVNARFDRVVDNLGWFRDYTRSRGTALGLSFCPMPQNWQEWPDIVAFSNRWGAPLRFTTVETPVHCSLQALGSRELARIVETLGHYDPPEGTPIERQNRQSYVDLLAQVRAHLAAAQEHESLGLAPVSDFRSYLRQMEVFVRSRESSAVAAVKLKQIEDALGYVLEYAERRGKRAAAEAKMIATPLELTHRSLPGMEKEEVLRLFQAYVMALD